MSEPVYSLTTENTDNLIISFAIPEDNYGGVISLILLRIPKFDMIYEEWERGVQVSDERTDRDDEFLEEFSLTDQTVQISTNAAKYSLDISKIDEEEIQELKKVIKKMNYDSSFRLYLE